MERDIVNQGVRLSKILQPEEGIAATCVDLTVLNAVEAPGVSEPNPLSGMSKNQLLQAVIDADEVCNS
jgi:hypothetical protein